MSDTPSIRFAREDDLPAIVSLLAADSLGASRECDKSPVPQGCRDAFAAIETGLNNEVIVAERCLRPTPQRPSHAWEKCFL